MQKKKKKRKEKVVDQISQHLQKKWIQDETSMDTSRWTKRREKFYGLKVDPSKNWYYSPSYVSSYIIV